MRLILTFLALAVFAPIVPASDADVAVALELQCARRKRIKPVPVAPAKPACICGAGCACPANACPGSCPVATRPDLTTTDGRVIRWNGSAYEFVGQSAVQSACPNGKCPLKR